MLPTKNVECLKWICQSCERECIPIRSESRCLCGHRLKEHTHTDYGCKNKSCDCLSFFFIVAEGSWILRCRCKHRHIDHDPNGHACKKAKCECGQFDSPWVCNCNHAWSQHRQIVSTKEVLDMSKMADPEVVADEMGELDIGNSMAHEVNRWDLIERGSPNVDGQMQPREGG